MRLDEFIAKYDKGGSVVLLEGKRKVVDKDLASLEKLGKLLASKTSHMQFRSGNAEGSDQLFSKGIAEVDPSRLEVIVPYDGHRKKTNLAGITHSLEALDLSMEPELVYLSKQNKKTENLVDKYVSGARDRYSIKAAYILRDTVKVIGAQGIVPASFALFYDDPDAPCSGGTGHTMRVCERLGIPFIDQSIWLGWLSE
jgi:hypothetical protein